MLFRPFSRLPLLVLLAGLCACSKSGTDTAAAPDGEEIDPYQNLVFQFDDAVVDEAQLNRWDTTRYVQFEPAVRGKFKWTTDRELVFSPSEPFRASTAFKATLRPQALPSGKKAPVLPRPKFHTPYLTLEAPQTYWGRSRRAAGTTELRVALPFNYSVRPADVKPLLRLTQDGQPVAFEILTAEPGKQLTVGVTQDVRPGTDLLVNLGSGLRAVGSDQPSASDYSLAVAVPDQQVLEVREVAGSLRNGEPVVTVQLSQPVAQEALVQALSVSPQVPYAVEALEGGFVLRGGFEVGRSYQVTLAGGLTGALGGQLSQATTQTVDFGAERPTLSFASPEKAMYLDALGARNLGVRINEVDKVQVTIAKVYANNLQQLLRAGSQYGYPEYNEESGDVSEQEEGGEYVDRSFQYYETENLGNVLTERTYTVAGLPKEQGLRLLNLSLKDLEFAGGLKGMYVVKVQDTERQWLQVSKLVTVSDIGLIVKQGAAGSTLVFANSIRTAKPLSGVEVRFVSTNNQVIGTGQTNREGVARFDSTAANGRFKLGMLVAQQGNDFTFLDLSGSRVETSRFEVGGLQSNAARYQAFLYGDRDLYRPGDTIQTNTVVRTESWQAPPKGLPVKIRLLLPTGKEYASLRRTLSAQGAFEARFILPPAVMTGLYTLEVLTGNDVLLTSRKLSVEEFIPDRMKVTVKAAPAVVRPGQTVTAQLTAQNLFGPPAADRKFEVEFSLKEKVFAPKKYADYTFSLNTGERRGRYSQPTSSLADRFEKTTREGTTDAAGRGSAAYEVPDYTDLGTLEGVAFATVFDETGRPVNRLATFEVQTQQVMFGIRRTDELVSTGRPVPVHLVALTPAGQPVNSEAQVTIVRLLWETVIERQGGRYTYNSQRREEVVINRTVPVYGGSGADSNLGFTPAYSGEYEIRVARPGASTYVSQQLYAYGYGNTASNSFEVNNEGEVTIEADKLKYQPGETAHLLLKTPFPGRVLVTVERDRVLDHFYVTTDEKSAQVDVPIRGGHVPNVYVTATAIRAITDNRLPLTVARGFVPLTVEKPEARLPVAISAPAQSRSQTTQTIEVTTTPGAQVTLAMVDEGILQMKDYRTPDPYAYFYQKRALEVQAYDVYPFLLPELGTSSSGGDASDLSRRTTPVPSRRVRLLARWSGVLTADASGKARYKLRVPQFSGAVRIMAVAYKNDAFGSAEHTMRVADPVVISTALPRFMSPGDTIDVPVTLTNTTGKSVRLEVLSLPSGPVAPIDRPAIIDGKVRGMIIPTVVLSSNTEGQVRLRFKAQQTIGTATVRIMVAAFDPEEKGSKAFATFKEIIELPVRPASPLQKRTGAGVVAGGAVQQLNLKTDFLPSSMRSQLVVSRSPMTEFAKDLRYLLQYPYGCLEQTVSAAFPQLYYGDLAATLGQKTGKTGKAGLFNPNYHVQEAIRKVEAQQMYNGSLSYWPGGDYDNWWATTYAAHFLLEAQQAGFDVNKSVLDRVLRYLETRTKKRETDTYNIIQTGGVIQQLTLAKKEIAYSLYVLALAGRPDAVGLNYYKANRKLLAEDSRWVLACAFALSGNQRSYREALPARFGVQSAAGRELAGSFSSPIRDEALVLNALLAADPASPQVNQLARQLSRQVKQAGWLNTQERAFALLALGKLAKKNAASTVVANLLADGKAIGNFSGKDLTVSNVANRQLALRTSGKGSLYYFWETEGISPTGQIREEDAYLKVRRQFLTRTGQPVGTPTFKQNDLVVVKITLQSAESAGEVQNVAITDLLPAGLEIENPRIGAVRDLAWATDAAQPDYLDVRDDRLNLFTTATPTPKAFYYLCRAVSKGTFKLGPVSADAMYNAEYHSYNGAGVVRVR